MPPSVKVTRDEVIEAAFGITRERGIDAATAREVARELGVSTRPIFTHYDSMDELRHDVYERAKECYQA